MAYKLDAKLCELNKVKGNGRTNLRRRSIDRRMKKAMGSRAIWSGSAWDVHTIPQYDVPHWTRYG